MSPDDITRNLVDRVDRLFPGASREDFAEKVRLVNGGPVRAGLVEGRREKLARFKAQVQRLLEAPGLEQRTPAWYEARRHMFTASELQELFGGANGMYNLIAKKINGTTNSLAGVKAIQWGVTYEPVACALYEHRNGCKVHEFGLLPHPIIPRFGASPDGITDQGIMLEIKCPYTRKITGDISKTYMTQIQTQLDTARLEECDFLECKIYEYETAEEYEMDTHPDDESLASNGMEKGVVCGEEVVIEDGAGSALRWHLERGGAGGEADPRHHLWRIDVYNCQRVHKDPGFMPSVEEAVRRAGKQLAIAEERGLEAVSAPPPAARPSSAFPFIM